MTRLRGRPLRWWDLVILTAFAVLGVYLAVATDIEYTMTCGGQQAFQSYRFTSLPVWVKERRHDAIRAERVGVAFLAALSVGLAVVVLRPHADARRPGAFGPGAIAAILTGFFTLASAIGWGVSLAIEPRSPYGGLPQGVSLPLGIFIDFYTTWGRLQPQAAWMILGAWSTLLATGRWRRAVDGADRLGRWLAVGWLILGLGQAAIIFIAWY
jgi:hypothetical protein